jgi:ABC-type polysaccharide/polyol phosphate transport system ATPase subunit
VSHALADIVETCERAVWIAEGRLVADGPAPEVTEAYHEWSQTGRLPEARPVSVPLAVGL